MPANESFWSKHVVEQERSGETLVEYAKRQGLKAATLSYWRTKLKRERGKGRFISLKSEPSAVLELHLVNGMSLRIPSGFQSEEVKRLLEALGC